MRLNPRLLVRFAALCVLLGPHATFAQVDWGEMFSDEGAVRKDAAPAPREPARAVAPEPPAPKAKKVVEAPSAARDAEAVGVIEERPVAPQPGRAAEKVPESARKPAPVAEVPAARSAPAESAQPVVAAPAPSGALVSLAEIGLREGDVIDRINASQYKSILTPGLEWTIEYGLRMKMIETKNVSLPRRYMEATEKYSGQVRLGKHGHSLENYVAGQPFPKIDPNDPDVAIKIMWNYYQNGALTDDLAARLFDADTGPIAKDGPLSVERHYIVDQLRRLSYVGRLWVDPKPNLPNQEGYRFKESLHPLLEPFDLKGVGATFYRYLDPERQDDSWLYLPQLRRVRRLSTAQRSDALFGQDTDIDSYYGYNGHVAWNDYRLVGEQVVTAIVHGRTVPQKFQTPEDWAFDDVWEPRRVWVMEAVSKLPQYAYGKRLLFMDKQAYFITHSDIYDRAGQLWKVWFNSYSMKKEAIPGAKVSVYDDEMPFQHGVLMVDTQLAHATKAALPSSKSKGEECIFFNMGEKSGTTEEFFSVAHLVASGH